MLTDQKVLSFLLQVGIDVDTAVHHEWLFFPLY